MPLPVILTFSPCGSQKTLAFMKWLGIAFPRWLEKITPRVSVEPPEELAAAAPDTPPHEYSGV